LLTWSGVLREWGESRLQFKKEVEVQKESREWTVEEHPRWRKVGLFSCFCLELGSILWESF
jgi:hypothetical protein